MTLLLDISIRLTKFIGHCHAPFTKKYVTGIDYLLAKDLLKPGMILITKTRGELSNLFIPGSFTHAAIYIGSDYVCEAIGKGVAGFDSESRNS